MSRYSAHRGSSAPLIGTMDMGGSHHTRLAHDAFGLLLDLARDLVRIALLKLRQEQLDGERTCVALLGELAEDPRERRHAVAGNDPRRLAEQLTRHVGHVLEMHVADFTGLEQIEILELTLARPEVIAVEQDLHVRM